MYSIKYHKQVVKFLQKQDKNLQKEIINFFDKLKDNPYSFDGYDVKTFKGYDNHYRLRVRKYRIIFAIIDNELIVKVIKAGSRGDIYK